MSEDSVEWQRLDAALGAPRRMRNSYFGMTTPMVRRRFA